VRKVSCNDHYKSKDLLSVRNWGVIVQAALSKASLLSDVQLYMLVAVFVCLLHH